MNYEQYKNKAYAKIKQYGSECNIERVIEEVYNKETNDYEKEIEIVSGYALQDAFEMENVNGTSIKAGDIKLMGVFNSKIKVGDTIIFGGKNYTVVNYTVLNPDGLTDIYYTIQCR